MSQDFNYDSFIKEFSFLQAKMLFLEKEKAKNGFKTIFLEANKHFDIILEQYKNAKKGDEHFFIKKQSQMILRYLKELDHINLNCTRMSEIELIKLFEKQYKLKKIVLKFKAHL